MLSILMVVLVAAEEPSPAVFHAANDELHRYVLEAAANHPDVQARYAEWEAALEVAPQVTALDDPRFMGGYFLLSERNRFKLALSQKFPWFGTLSARGDKASKEGAAAYDRFCLARNRAIRDVKQAYFEYAFLGEAVQVTKSLVDMLAFMEDTVNSKYSLGLAQEDELLRVRIERSIVADRLEQLLTQRSALSARLAAAIGRDPDKVLPWPQDAGLPPDVPATLNLGARIRAANPEVRALEHMAQSRAVETELARKKGWPDLTVGIEYTSLDDPPEKTPDRPYPATLNGIVRIANSRRQDFVTSILNIRKVTTGQMPSPPVAMNPASTLVDLYAIATANEPMAYADDAEDNLMVSLSVNVPIWRGKVRAGVQEARLKESAVRHSKRAKVLALESGAEDALFRMRDGKRRHALYTDRLLPEARAVYESLVARYAAGEPMGMMSRVDFLDLLEAVNDLLRYELEGYKAAADAYVAAAELEYALGEAWAE